MTTAQVIWTDVAPRDGLQSWKQDPVATDVKVRLIRGLVHAGLPRVEATSFVSPRWVPQMADAADVLAALGDVLPHLRVLVPNSRGLEMALAAGVTNVLVTVGVTDAFNRANVNRTLRESLDDLVRITDQARTAGCAVDVALSVCFGCPYEGAVDPRRVVDVISELAALDVAEIGIADTIGVATPRTVDAMIGAAREAVDVERLSLHVHDTRGLGVTNVLAGYAAGVRRFDGSAGGVGGCPFAPRSTGNVCSEDALSALIDAGAEIGVDLDRLCAVSTQLARDLDAELPGKLYRAGIWSGSPVGKETTA